MQNLSVIQEHPKKLAEQKKVLLAEISALGIEKERLDMITQNHDAAKQIYQDLSDDIEKFTDQIRTIETEINSLEGKKRKLKSEIASLTIPLQEKEDLTIEITKLNQIVSALKDDIKYFQADFNAKKEIAEKHISGLLDQAKALKKGGEDIINQL